MSNLRALRVSLILASIFVCEYLLLRYIPTLNIDCNASTGKLIENRDDYWNNRKCTIGSY